jgi:hypothetical protein
MWKPSVRGWSALALVSAVVLGTGLPAGAAPRVDPFPSWDQVNAAKQNEQAKAAEVSNINGLLDQLEDETARLTDEALQRGQEYLQAKSAAEAAASYAETLQAQADAAAEKADLATTQAGQLAAQLYRSGGDTTTNLLLNQGDSSSLLYRLGTMSKLTEQTSRIRDAAEAAKNTAETLEKQATVAKTQRDALEDTAETRLADAQAAQEATEADLASTKTSQQTLVAQLASLNNTSADLEKKYRDGLAAIEAQRAAEAAAAAAAAASSSGGSEVDDTPGSAWVPGSGEVASPAVAQAFAESIMGNYGWGGDQFQCLVRLWIGESGWRANAYNDSSGAYGIPQSLPASKMASVGSDFVTNHETQIIWGMNYISDRYGTPCSALSQWTARNPHWY